MSSENKPKIEPGKWRNRLGECMEIRHCSPDGEIFWIDQYGSVYYKDGRYTKFGKEHPKDLIAPWPDAPAHSQEASVEQPLSVDIVRHEVEELRKANAELLSRCDNAQAATVKLMKECDELTQERDKLAGEVAMHQRSAAEARRKVAELTAELAQLREPPAAEYAWRDARPEDVGRKYKAQVKDRVQQDWSVLGRILVGHDPGYSFPWTTDKNGTECTWKFCQVYAPVEQPPAAPAEVWRELKAGEDYHGPGQVRDKPHHDWIDATIAACDNREGLPFIARAKHHSAYDAWAFARIKESEQSK